MSGIEGVAKTWLADPPWQKVFKHTVDVLQDYVSYILIALGGICLSVRLLTTLGTGDLVCIIIGVKIKGSNETLSDLGPYPSGGSVGMINYANTDSHCIDAVFDFGVQWIPKFYQYLPYILLLETLLLIVVEKSSFKIPKIAQRVERFYKNIVEESLFGKDPDVAEDMYEATDIVAITRRRQRNEICVLLKRSSFIHHVYIGKNVLEILLVLLFSPLNIVEASAIYDHDAKCEVEIQQFPGIIEQSGVVNFQCHGKKTTFYAFILWAQIVLLLTYALFSIIAIVWCFYFRSVSNLLTTIESMRHGEGSLKMLKDATGQDFLFLFDLLAHSCGLESTLRVLTHSDDTFHDICKPSIDDNDPERIKVEEDKLKIKWGPSDIERWLQSGPAHKTITVDSYEVTIFPTESVYNTCTVKSHLSNGTPLNSLKFDTEFGSSEQYQQWFFDLNGGRTEYAITIATMIGKSRMKGEKVVTNLKPYGAEKPRSGMLKNANTHSVEVFWDPPKGDFTKYVLYVDDFHKENNNKKLKSSHGFSLLRINSHLSTSTTKGKTEDTEFGSQPDAIGETKLYEDVHENLIPHDRTFDLSHKTTEYIIMGLQPGEKYSVELNTKTGKLFTRQPIHDTILTRPLPPKGLRTSEISSNSCLVSWLLPDGHSCLRGFQIQIKFHDGKIFKDFAVFKKAKSHLIDGLQPCHDYVITVTALCTAENEMQKTESDVSSISLTTTPEKIKNLKLDGSTFPNSIPIKWDAPLTALNLRYKLTINANTEKVPDSSFIVDDILGFSQKLSAYPSTTTILGGNSEPSTPTVVPMNVSRQSTIQNIRDFSSTFEVSGDKTQYTFTKLPEIIGTGHAYDITIVALVKTDKSDGEVISPENTERFITKPLPATNLKIANSEKPYMICWYKSITSTVTSYKIKWNPIDSLDGSIKREEMTVLLEDLEKDGDLIYFCFPPEQVRIGSAYKVNVHAIAESCGLTAESKELHEKFIFKNSTEIALFSEEQS